MSHQEEEPTKLITSQLVQKQVVDWLRQAIMRGKLHLGQRLVENDLARDLGVSRGPVREALQFLTGEGLVDHIPRVGRFVHMPSPEQVRQVQEIRGALEGLAVRRLSEIAKQEGHPSWLDQLQELAISIQDSFEKGDLESFHNGNQSFHEILVRTTRDNLLERFHNFLMSQVALFRQLAVSIDEYPSKLFKEHFSIIEALRQGDGEKAEQMVRAHTVHGMEVILDALNVTSTKSDAIEHRQKNWASN